VDNTTVTVDDPLVDPQVLTPHERQAVRSEDNPAHGATLSNRKKPGLSTIPRTYYFYLSFSLIRKE
jgi:hypothetical protein